jgi:hypothetical protein
MGGISHHSNSGRKLVRNIGQVFDNRLGECTCTLDVADQFPVCAEYYRHNVQFLARCFAQQNTTIYGQDLSNTPEQVNIGQSVHNSELSELVPMYANEVYT